MLCIIFTKKKLLAGVKADTPQLLQLKGRTHVNLDARSMSQVLESQLDIIGDAYTTFAQKNGIKTDGAIQTALAFPVDFNNSVEREKIVAVLGKSKGIGLKFVHADNLAVSFLHGMEGADKVTAESCAILESLDEYTHLYLHLKRKLAVSLI